MKSDSRNIFIAAALAAAAVAVTAQAADQSTLFEQQRQITDGYYPQYNVVPRAKKPASPRTAAENAWLEKERISDSNGSRPVPFVPPVAAASAAASHNQAQAGTQAASDGASGD